jgi:hypothetical protein
MNEEKRWLSEWYRKCRNKYIDLVGDFGGNIFLFIYLLILI